MCCPFVPTLLCAAMELSTGIKRSNLPPTLRARIAGFLDPRGEVDGFRVPLRYGPDWPRCNSLKRRCTGRAVEFFRRADASPRGAVHSRGHGDVPEEWREVRLCVWLSWTWSPAWDKDDDDDEHECSLVTIGCKAVLLAILVWLSCRSVSAPVSRMFCCEYYDCYDWKHCTHRTDGALLNASTDHQ